MRAEHYVVVGVCLVLIVFDEGIRSDAVRLLPEDAEQFGGILYVGDDTEVSSLWDFCALFFAHGVLSNYIEIYVTANITYFSVYVNTYFSVYGIILKKLWGFMYVPLLPIAGLA